MDYNYGLLEVAPIAQLDRALVFGTSGWEFESLWAHFEFNGAPGFTAMIVSQATASPDPLLSNNRILETLHSGLDVEESARPHPHPGSYTVSASAVSVRLPDRCFVGCKPT